MTKMITSLTTDQQSQLAVYRDEGLEVGLSTERVDFEVATKALEAVFANVDCPMPKTVLFASGPTDAYKLFKQNVKSGTWSNFISNTIFGNHDSYFLYFYKYFNDVVGLDLKKILPLCEYAKVGGWCYVDENLAIIVDRPSVIRMDDRNLSHSETGPAIAYLDGTEVYMWHGVRVFKNWIVDRTLTAAEALKVENTEQRRAACEILGWATILEQLSCKEINVDADPQIGTLLEAEIPEIGKEKFLKVLCGTGRTFCIPVPPEMKTALEANAWTFNIEPDVLRMLEVRT